MHPKPVCKSVWQVNQLLWWAGEKVIEKERWTKCKLLSKKFYLMQDYEYLNVHILV